MHKKREESDKEREDEGRAEEESSCKTVGFYKLNLKRINAESYRQINVNVLGLPRGQQNKKEKEGEREYQRENK